MNRIGKIFASIGWKLFLLSMPLHASLGGERMPWEEPLKQIADSLAGPVARAAGVIAIAGAGLALAIGESGGFFRKMIQIVFGLAIAFSAATWGLSFLGYGSGALIP